MRKLILATAIALIILCACRALAQEKPLGEGFYGDWRVTAGGVAFDDGHLSDAWKKPVKKSYNRILALGGSQDLADSFLSLAQQMRGMDSNFRNTADRLWFARAIDSAVEEVKARFDSCGEPYASAARKARLRIVIRDTIWQIDTPIYSGWVRGQSQLIDYRNHVYQIDAVALYPVGFTSGDLTGELAEAHSIIVWEIANVYADILGYRPTSIDSEVGTRRPCEVFNAR